MLSILIKGPFLACLVVSLLNWKFTSTQSNQRLLEKKERAAQAEINAMDEFISIASHELKTPLTSLALRIELLQRYLKKIPSNDNSFANLQSTLNFAENDAKRLSKLIDTLLTTTALSNTKLELNLEEVNLSSLTENTVSPQMQRDAVEAGCQIKVNSNVSDGDSG